MRSFPALVPALLISGLLCAGSCKQISVAHIKSSSFETRRGTPVVFENDDLRISYNFWTKYGGGSMGFTIYNKLDVPVYIDWKASGFIPGNQMFPYWQDATSTEHVARTTGYYYYGFGAATTKVSTTTYRQEQVSVVPPHTAVSRQEYILVPRTKRFVPKPAPQVSVPLPYRPGETIRARGKSYTASESPLKFRNYLSYSLSRSMDSEPRQLDHTFYMADLWELKQAKYMQLRDSGAFYMR